MQCNTTQYNAKNAMQCKKCNAKNTMQFNTIQYNSQTFKQLPGNLEQCNETSGQCNKMQYNAMQCNVIQCN